VRIKSSRIKLSVKSCKTISIKRIMNKFNKNSSINFNNRN